MLRRIALVAVVALLTVGCTVGAPAAAADPVGAVNRLIGLIQAKQFDQVPSAVCEARRADIAQSLNPAAALGEQLPGTDAQQLLDAMTIAFTDSQVTEVSRTGDRAVVQLTGTMAVTFDTAKVREFVRAALEAQGQPATDASIDAAIGMMESFLSSVPVDTQLDVVNEAGQWLVCDDLVD